MSRRSRARPCAAGQYCQHVEGDKWWTCKGCRNRYHWNCSGAADDAFTLCDDCWHTDVLAALMLRWLAVECDIGVEAADCLPAGVGAASERVRCPHKGAFPATLLHAIADLEMTGATP